MSQSFDYINFNDFYLARFGGDYDESIVDDDVSFVKSVRLTKKKKPPICNRFKSDRALEEVRADLFD